MKNLIIAGIGVLLLAGVAWTLLGGGTTDPSLVHWSEGDETSVSGDDEPEAAPDALGSENGTARTALDAPQGESAANTNDADVARVPVTLKGRVVDSMQQPVANATVMLEVRRENGRPAFGRGNRDRQRVRKPVETARDGTFTFAGPGYAEMAVSVMITHRQFAPAMHDRSFRAGSAAGQNSTFDLGDLQLTSGGTVAGSVTDLDQIAIGNAVVRLLPQGGNRFAWGPQRDELFPEVKVDANGWFTLAHVAPGQYRVHATAPGRLQETSDVITVSDGLEEQLEPLRLGPGATLTGVVYGPSGGPVTGAEVVTRGRRGEERTTSDERGAFTIDHLPSGAVTVNVTAKGFLSWSRPDVDPSKAPLVVQLAEGLRLRGIVRDAVTGEIVTRYAAKAHRIGALPDPQHDAQVEQARAEMQRVRDLMRQAGIGRGGRGERGERAPELSEAERAAARQQMNELRQRMEAASEALERLDVQRGPADFRRQGPGGRRGGNDGPRGGNDGPRGGDRGRRGNGGDFVSRVQNMPRDVGDVIERPNGTFTFSGLDEGVWVVDVGSPVHQRVRSEPIELRAGSGVPEVSIVLPRGLTVSGKVLSSPGTQAIANAQVELILVAEDDLGAPTPAAAPGDPRNAMRMFWAEARRNSGPRGVPVLSARSNAAGEFQLRNAPPGRYAVQAQAEGHARRAGEVFELTQDQSGVQLVLGALASIEGRVSGIPRGREQEAHVIAFAGMGSMATTDVQPDGSYRIADLQPGSYVVRAFLGEMRGFLGRQMAELMRTGEPPRMDVTLEEGEVETFNVAVMLQPTGQVTGVVLKNGEPAKGLRVTLTSVENDGPGSGAPVFAFGPGGRDGRRGQQWQGAGGGGTRGLRMGGNYSAVTDQRGNFLLQDVPEGTYTLHVRSDGRGRSELHEQQVQVREDAQAQLTISISTGSLEGTVVLAAAEASQQQQARNAPGQPGAGQSGGSLDGNLRLLPGVSSIPEDIGAFAREHNVQQVPVRNGTFRASDVPAGPYLLLLNLRGREPVTRQVYVGAAGSERLQLEAGPRRQQQPGQGQGGAAGQGQGPGQRQGPGGQVQLPGQGQGPGQGPGRGERNQQLERAGNGEGRRGGRNGGGNGGRGGNGRGGNGGGNGGR